ncbi:hypothetical protein LCGC14_2035220 [marine sediment metagenome]|uniref:Uncharacterized protein n=1 Tax=marine sediment metagenome TaxID=412755 RepID=A0A0F9FG33_9ZZZZ
MTQQSKFTPGPWRLCYDGQIDGADGNFVCSFRWSSYKDFNDPENKATARLIAAAPELLEALRAIIHPDNERHIEFDSRREYYVAQIEGGEYHMAMQAIAKAEPV